MDIFSISEPAKAVNYWINGRSASIYGHRMSFTQSEENKTTKQQYQCQLRDTHINLTIILLARINAPWSANLHEIYNSLEKRPWNNNW